MWLFAPKNGKTSFPDPNQPVAVREKNSLRICKILDNFLLCENITLFCKILILFSKHAQVPFYSSLQIDLQLAS